MYVKLFSSLYQGTLRGRTNEILVFTNLLAHADQYGVVDKHWKAIAEETGLTVEQVKEACEALEAVDEESRSPEEDGRRILKTDGHRGWGWRITNYGKYRAIRNEDDRREQNRLAQERWREKNKQKRKQDKQSKPRSAQAEADTEVKAKDQKTAPSGVDFGDVSEQVVKDFTAHRKALRAPITQTGLNGIRREASKAGVSLETALALCCSRGWRGFKAEWLAETARAGPNGLAPSRQFQALQSVQHLIEEAEENERHQRADSPRLVHEGDC